MESSMDQLKPSIPSSEKVTNLITEKTKDDPAKRTELLTRAKILRPLLDAPDKLGMTSEEEKAVRKYARAAGEKDGAQVKEKLSQNPTEQIDLILQEVASKINPENALAGSFSALEDTSRNIRFDIKEYGAAASIEQQKLIAEKGSAISFEEACESLDAKRSYERKYPHIISTTRFVPEIAGEILQRLGIKPEAVTLENFIAGLKNDGRWKTENATSSDIKGSTVITPEDPLRQGVAGFLDSNIPGVKVNIVALRSHRSWPNIQGDDYRLVLSFDKKTFHEMVKVPEQPSIFDITQTPAPQSALSPQA